MRASELLGRQVRLPDGQERIVVGLRAVDEGPAVGGGPAIRLEGVIVSNRHTGAYLGFQDRDQQGPRLIGTLVRWAHRGTQVLPWEDVRDQLLTAGEEHPDC